MTPFYLNNSSFPYLTCSKRYHLQVVQGLKTPPGGNKYTAAGIAFHKMMQIIGTEACPDINLWLLFARDKLPEKITSIPETQALQLGRMAQRIYTEHPELFADCRRELHFEYHLPEDANANSAFKPYRTGTIDLLTYDPTSDTVIITDYKTTAKPIDGNLITSYALTSQRFYYQLAVYYLNNLPAHYISAIKSHRLAWRYCFVSAEKDEYHLAQPQLVNLIEQETFFRLFREKALLADYIHNDPTLAVKEGILNGSCWRCPFTSICTAETEDNLITNWPYGTAPYNPKHQDD